MRWRAGYTSIEWVDTRTKRDESKLQHSSSPLGPYLPIFGDNNLSLSACRAMAINLPDNLESYSLSASVQAETTRICLWRRLTVCCWCCTRTWDALNDEYYWDKWHRFVQRRWWCSDRLLSNPDRVKMYCSYLCITIGNVSLLCWTLSLYSSRTMNWQLAN